MTNDEMIAHAYGLIDDPDGAIPPAEMALHLEDIALDFSKRSKVMRKDKQVSFLADKPKLILPEDCYELIRVLDANNREVLPCTRAQLSETFETDSATVPDGYLRELTGPDMVWLYPKPTTTGTLTLYYFAQHVVGSPIEIPHSYHLTLVWGLAAKAISKSGNPADQAKVERFAKAYEAGVMAARGEAFHNFSSRPRRTRFQFI